MKEFSGKDLLEITYEGPPQLVNGEWVNGDTFFLAGDRNRQAREGVELARGISGILRPAMEYRYDTSADQPGSTFVDYVTGRRTIQCSVNVFGDTPSDLRRNWRRWLKNNPPHVEGKLWFRTSDAPKRYAFVRPGPNAGSSTLDYDPMLLAKMENIEWGWESDFSCLFGEIVRKNYSSTGTVEVVNPSDIDGVYPKVYLVGPGRFQVNGITTPTITADETIRLNFDPMRQTYVKRNMKTGAVTNLWYTLAGKRPEMSVPQGAFTHSIKALSGSPTASYIEFTPLYQGVI